MNIETKNFEKMREDLQAKVFSSIAHDFKTPLACIIGSLATLDQMKDRISIEQRDILIKTALKESHRLDILVTSILEKNKP